MNLFKKRKLKKRVLKEISDHIDLIISCADNTYSTEEERFMKDEEIRIWMKLKNIVKFVDSINEQMLLDTADSILSHK